MPVDTAHSSSTSGVRFRSTLHAHRLRGLRGRSPDTGTAVERRFLGRQIQLVDQPVRAVGLQSIRNSLSNELTIARAKICASKKSQTQITALGNLPNAVIGEP